MSTSLLEKNEATAAELSGERQVVALHLGGEVYGVDIACIHTVIMPQAITQVPKAPNFVLGVMNLRGRILPVIDLRRRFGLPEISEEQQKNARIVIVDVEGLSAGLVVDAVSEVLRLRENAIDPPSRLVASPETECIVGIGKIPSSGAPGGERLILLLDVYKALTMQAGDAESLRTLQEA